MPKLPVARAVWKPAPDLHTSTESVADRRRAAPHGAVHGADPASTSFDLADLTGTELVLIDGDHDGFAGSARELRWNQAYHRLAQGF